MSKLNIVLQKISFWGTASVTCAAVLGLLGYIPGLRLLASWSENFIPMAPTTAVCFILLGGLLALINKNSNSKKSQILPITLSALVTLLGGFGVLEFDTGVNLNIENWLTPEPGKYGEIPVGHISMSTRAIMVKC